MPDRRASVKLDVRVCVTGTAQGLTVRFPSNPVPAARGPFPLRSDEYACSVDSGVQVYVRDGNRGVSDFLVTNAYLRKPVISYDAGVRGEKRRDHEIGEDEVLRWKEPLSPYSIVLQRLPDSANFKEFIVDVQDAE